MVTSNPCPGYKQLRLAPKLDKCSWHHFTRPSDLYGSHPEFWRTRWYRVRSRVLQVVVTKFPTSDVLRVEIWCLPADRANRANPQIVERQGDTWEVVATANRVVSRCKRIAANACSWDPNELRTCHNKEQTRE